MVDQLKPLRLLVLDFETSGLNPIEDRIIESGVVLWDSLTATPLLCHSVFLNDPDDEPISEEITEITGITNENLLEFGQPRAEYADWLNFICEKHKVDFLVGHNIKGFDIKFLDKLMMGHDTYALDLPVIDTMGDLPIEGKQDSHKLKYMAADHGIINPFAHRAVFDSLTTLMLMNKYPLDKVVARSKIPEVIIRAMVPHPKEDGGKGKDIAKDLGFRWQQIGDLNFPYCWVKQVKEDEIAAEQLKLIDYKIVKIK